MKTQTLYGSLRLTLGVIVIALGSLAACAQGPGAPGAPGGGMNPMVGNAIGGPGPVIGISGPNQGNSLPAPGSPNPTPAPPPAPAPVPPSAWGSPWWNGWNPSPTVVISPSVTVNNLNSGRIKVIACGYDAMGVWRVLPLYVQYDYNGVNYNVTVLNAWDPWTDMWNRDVDVQAFSTNYLLRGVTYNYYVVLSYGTFYFNL